MSVGRTLYGGSPYLGVYLRVGERYAIAPASVPHALARDLARLLDVEVVRTNVNDSEVVGALVAADLIGPRRRGRPRRRRNAPSSRRSRR